MQDAEKAAHRAQERLKRYRAAVLHAAVSGDLTCEWRKHNKPSETGEEFLKSLLSDRRTHWEQMELKRLRAINKIPENELWKTRYPEPKQLKLENQPKLPNNWTWSSVDQLVFNVTDGDHQPPPQSETGVPLIVIGNIKNGRLDFSNTRYVTRDYASAVGELRKPRHGDVLYSLVGSFGTAILVKTKNEFCIQRHIGILRPHRTSPTTYLSMALNSDFVFNQANAAATGTAQQTVPLVAFRAFAIPLPSDAEQQEIVLEVKRRLTAADRLAATIDKQLMRARTSRQFLLREAFAGRLISQDSNDEPAYILVERIRDAREAEAKKPKGKRMSKPKSAIKALNHRSLLTVLKENGGPMTPEELFQAAGYVQESVDRFFAELRDLTDSPVKVVEERKTLGQSVLRVVR